MVRLRVQFVTRPPHLCSFTLTFLRVSLCPPRSNSLLSFLYSLWTDPTLFPHVYSPLSYRLTSQALATT